MKRYIFSQWKVHKAIVALIIIGFFIADIILSVGITLSKRQFEHYHDRLMGNPDDQVMIDFKIEDSDKILAEINKLKEFGELQVVSGSMMLTAYKNKECNVLPIPVWFEREEEWHIPILKGRYLKVEDIEEQNMVVILGKHTANELGANVDDIIQINGMSYKVVGIAGRSYEETQWDDLMYLPGQKLCDNNQDYLAGFTSVLLKSGKERFQNEYKISKNVQYEELSNQFNTDGLKSGIASTALLSGCVFVVAIVNMSNLMLYWVLERKKTYGIIKAIGGHNGYILKIILSEVFVLTFTSSIFALGVLEIIHIFFTSLPVELTVLNFVVSVLVAFFTGGISAIIPAISAMKMQPVEILNEGDM